MLEIDVRLLNIMHSQLQREELIEWFHRMAFVRKALSEFEISECIAATGVAQYCRAMRIWQVVLPAIAT